MLDTPFVSSVERRRPGASMRAFVSRTLSHHSAIVVSNRAPHEPRPEGGFARGAGGVVTALLTLAEVTAADWVCCARNDAERKLVAERGDTWTARLIRSATRLHYVSPTREQYDRYYSVIANPMLWFVQHYLWDLAQQPIINGRIHRAWRDGYAEVNTQVARKVVEVGNQLPHRPLVLVHDYQLYLVPKMVREHRQGFSRLREAADPPSRAQTPGLVLGVPAALAAGRRHLQDLPAPSAAGGGAHQQAVRRRPLGANPPGVRRERP